MGSAARCGLLEDYLAHCSLRFCEFLLVFKMFLSHVFTGLIVAAQLSEGFACGRKVEVKVWKGSHITGLMSIYFFHCDSQKPGRLHATGHFDF